MTNELVINDELNTPRLLNDKREKQVKVLLSIQPSDEIRKKAKMSQQKQVGVDVCIVLDVSGSMRDIIGGEFTYTGETKMVEGRLCEIVTGGVTKLDSAISAIKRLVPLLREEDTLSLVAYEDDSHVIFKGLKKKDQGQILAKVDECRKYQGNTNISGALRESRLLLNQFSSSRPKRIIFLTDGNPVGDTEENGILEGQLLADFNITIDCLGIGEDFNYNFIQRIAESSKGRTDMIESPEDAEKIFKQLFKSSQEVLATNVELKFHFSPQVRVTDHYRAVPENMYLGKVPMSKEDRSYTIKLGQIETNQRYDYYFLITVPAQSDYVGLFRLFKAEVSYYLPGLATDIEKTAKNIMVEFVGDPGHAKQRSSKVEKGYTLAEVMKSLREAEGFKKKGDKVNTFNRYQEVINKYQGLGLTAEADMYIKILDEFTSTGEWSNDEINKAHKGSSSAVEDSGELGVVIDDMKIDDIFAGHRRRR